MSLTLQQAHQKLDGRQDLFFFWKCGQEAEFLVDKKIKLCKWKSEVNQHKRSGFYLWVPVELSMPSAFFVWLIFSSLYPLS